MYIPDAFSEQRPDEIKRIISENALATLVTLGPNGLDANQIPFELVEFDGRTGKLSGHIARANPLWQEISSNSDVLVVFRATDGYVSPNWYPSKQATHKVVPTWNYQVVNIRGQIEFFDDERRLRAIVGRLTRTNETRSEGKNAWRMADAPPDFMSERLQQIIGIEITITGIEAKSKLSQNRPEADREAVAVILEDRGQTTLSQAIRDA